MIVDAFADTSDISHSIQTKQAIHLNKEIKFEKLTGQADSHLFSSPFMLSKGKSGELRVSGKAFKKLEGHEIGLSKGFEYTIRDYTDPFWIGRGTAAGDYNNDGWQDIIFGSNNGFILYKNLGGRFELQQLISQEINKLQVYAVAFVDMNNDGWLDIFFTTFNHGNFLVLNKRGVYDFQHLITVPNQNAVLTLSPSFADLDLNGQLDIVNGNVALGVITGMNHISARRNNSIVFNGDLEFRDVALEKTSGETMATLVTDLNNDGITDIYMGNDFIVPDKILLGTGNGYIKVTGNKFIPFTPFFSMGSDSGDINNDLAMDLVVTGTMYMAPFVGKQAIDGKTVTEYSQFKGGPETCLAIVDKTFRENCLLMRNSKYIEALSAPLNGRLDTEKQQNISVCKKIKNTTDKDICLTKVMWQLITQNKPVTQCEKQFGDDEKLLQVCEVLKLKGNRYERRDLYGAIPQDDRNMLYTFDTDKNAYSLATEFKHPGGWTWNSKIVDLDNDGWQDVITSDGTVRKDDFGWNVLMKNIDGKRFEQQQFSAGVTSDFGLYSFALIDMDNDGDLDIIGNSAEGPVQVYRNNSTMNNHSLAISLIDHNGNYNGIGARIEIHYDKRRLAQVREIKASGGYMSFDPAIAYFGLGNKTVIDEIKVHWPDKTQSIYSGPFKSEQHYRIERIKNNGN